MLSAGEHQTGHFVEVVPDSDYVHTIVEDGQVVTYSLLNGSAVGNLIWGIMKDRLNKYANSDTALPSTNPGVNGSSPDMPSRTMDDEENSGRRIVFSSGLDNHWFH